MQEHDALDTFCSGLDCGGTTHFVGRPTHPRHLPLPVGDGAKRSLSSTEIPWEAYDAFLFRLEEKDPSFPPGVDAIARPSQPYITMDRAFGHAGYPVISVSYRGAQGFCAWLSTRTGRKFLLPTEAEWQVAARADGTPPDLAATAWTRETADRKTHPIGTKAPNTLGFHDLLGNAAEWCTAPDGTGSCAVARSSTPPATSCSRSDVPPTRPGTRATRRSRSPSGGSPTAASSAFASSAKTDRRLPAHPRHCYRCRVVLHFEVLRPVSKSHDHREVG